MLNALTHINSYYIYIYNILTFFVVLVYIYIDNKNTFFNKFFIKENTLVWLCVWLLSALPFTSLFLLKLIILIKNNSSFYILVLLVIIITTFFLLMYFIHTQTNFSSKKLKVISYNEYTELYLIFSFFILNFFYPYFILFLI